MTFRVKLRIKSLNPCYPVKPAPVSRGIPPIESSAELLRRLYQEALKRQNEIGSGQQWERRWASTPYLPDPRFNPGCTVTFPRGNDWFARNGDVQ